MLPPHKRSRAFMYTNGRVQESRNLALFSFSARGVFYGFLSQHGEGGKHKAYSFALNLVVVK